MEKKIGFLTGCLPLMISTISHTHLYISNTTTTTTVLDNLCLKTLIACAKVILTAQSTFYFFPLPADAVTLQPLTLNSHTVIAYQQTSVLC